MSDANPFGFGEFVPGFDFLQGLTKSPAGGIPHMPQLASWVAPTLSEEELEKRIEELKAVQFWLDQNSRALTATVQALEVQKMTLATLKGMNVHMADVANAFKVPSTARSAPPAPASSPQPAPAEPARPAAESDNAASGASAGHPAPSASDAAPGIVDPMQWWGALTEQFQHIAAAALKDAAAQVKPGSTAHKATARAAPVKGAKASKSASAPSKAPARKAAAKKAAPRKTSAAAKRGA